MALLWQILYMYINISTLCIFKHSLKHKTDMYKYMVLSENIHMSEDYGASNLEV